MKKLWSVIALVFVCTLGGCKAPQRAESAWEYKVVRKVAYSWEIEKELNTLSDQGWSVVTVSLSEWRENQIGNATIVLKRSKRNPQPPAQASTGGATSL